MSNALKYRDLSYTERLAYERIVGQGPSSESAPCDAETPHDTRQPARRRPFLAAATSLGCGGTDGFRNLTCHVHRPQSSIVHALDIRTNILLRARPGQGDDRRTRL
jgi:hypothetical protein